MDEITFQNLLSRLELPQDDMALRWVSEQNDRTLATFARGARFQQRQQSILQVLNNRANIPWSDQYHGNLYNFWQDDDHPRGIWRRTHEASYLTAEPEWETVLDMDRLNQDENADWRFQGAELLYPDFTRALVSLSGGGDACEIREFDLISKSFVSNGFFLPESKSSTTWLDKDTLLLALDSGGDSLTLSGYPRCVRRWQRGTPPQDATLIYAGEMTDIAVSAWQDVTPGYEKTLLQCNRDLYHSRSYLLTAHNTLEVISIPEDASCGFFCDWLLITLSSDWHDGEHIWPSGALLATDFTAFQQGRRHFSALFMPDRETTCQGYSATRDYLLLNLTRDGVGVVDIFHVENGQWRRVQTLTLPDYTCVSAVGMDFNSNRYQLFSEGYLQPCRLSYGDLDGKTLSVVKQEPVCFDPSDFAVTRHFARSQDGTPVPYFQIATRALAVTGENPTLLYGYGGFGVSLIPSYLGAKGITWLQKGGIYVVANIRGGGEYGPQWHQVALKQYRYRAFEDFAAVATDLITRRLTCPSRLAAQGGSNGGLLVGNMLTDYPALFGAIVCEVPLLDMTNYHRWLAGASWIAEYGDPDIPEERQWLKKYSPFDKVTSGKRYPPVLFITGTQDDRVSPAHARKMAARMQQLGHHNVWLYEDTDAGHGNAPENTQIAFYHAMVEEFLWQMLMNQ